MLQTIAAFDRIGEENAFAVLARAGQLQAQGRVTRPARSCCGSGDAPSAAALRTPGRT